MDHSTIVLVLTIQIPDWSGIRIPDVLVFFLSLSLCLFLSRSRSFSPHYLLSAQSLWLKNNENVNFNFNYILKFHLAYKNIKHHFQQLSSILVLIRLIILTLQLFIPLQAKQVREVPNLNERKNLHTPIYGVKEFFCLSLRL